MSNAATAHDLEAAAQAKALFKRDHPRRIDTVIDYFGGESAPPGDPCGEAFLEDSLDGDDE